MMIAYRRPGDVAKIFVKSAHGDNYENKSISCCYRIL